MKKLILLGVVAFVAAFSVPAEAQISVNVNIGPRPQYVPVRYVNTDYYYGAPARPVYVNRVYTVKHNRHNNWRPVRTRYVSRPVVYQRPYYKNDRGPKHSYYKVKSHKWNHGNGKNKHSRGRR
ncbi:MAG: hypothetical protein EOO89_05875 [Pedobacter sp.]|nr:MAG: hypothetical protein EOO89_05875 [Pedobacter sp.]